jgi:hypothetical protein
MKVVLDEGRRKGGGNKRERDARRRMERGAGTQEKIEGK